MSDESTENNLNKIRLDYIAEKGGFKVFRVSSYPARFNNVQLCNWHLSQGHFDRTHGC